jgi:rhodanese-related sulfurtransferase
MPTTIDREEVRRLIAGGAQLVEVLLPRVYEAEHLPGAINIPLSRLDQRTMAELPRHRPVIVYCADMQ